MSNLLGLEEERRDVGDSQYPDASSGPDPELAGQVKRGANWFYWIAGLSVVNSVIFLFGADVAFLAGLGFTILVDALIDVSIHNGAPALLKAVAVIFDLILVIVFALFAYYAGKRFSVAFIIGILVYALDALLLLALGLYFMAAFHAFALFFIIRGFLACRKLNAYDASRPLEPAIGG
jgi:hypothetical protein